MFDNTNSLPQNWKSTTFGKLAEFLNGYAFAPDDWQVDGLPIIRIEQLRDENAKADYYDEPLHERFRLKNGDLVFSWSASLLTRIWDRGDAYLNQHLFKVENYSDVNRIFLKYLIDFNIDAMAGETHGSTMKHITRPALLNYIVKIPDDIKEQNTIANILSTIDEAIAQSESLVRKHQSIKQGLMFDLLTRGVDENGELRPSFEEAPNLYHETELGWLPKDWKVKNLGIFCELQNHLRKPISAIERENLQGEYPYYGPTGILDYLNEYRVEGEFVLIGEDGDHFLKFANWSMTQFVKGKFNVNNHAHIMKGKNGCSTEWLHRFFSHRDITLSLTRQGAGRFKLNKTSLLQLHIAVPKAEEQNQICKIISAMEMNIQTSLENIEKLHNLKQGLMQDLLSGQVRVKV